MSDALPVIVPVFNEEESLPAFFAEMDGFISICPVPAQVLFINFGIQDTCCPLKIIKTACARQIPFFIGMHRFLPALLQLQGGKEKQLAVSHSSRIAGTSKYHLFNRLVGPFFDTLAFRWLRSRYIRYDLVDNAQ